MQDLLQLVVYGIVTGSILALGAIGVSLIFSILRFAHFAHGDLMTVGAYGALIVTAGLGVGPLWGIPLGIVIAIAVAFVAERLLYRPLRLSSPVILLISSFGVALILRSLIQLVAGTGVVSYKTGIQMPVVIEGIRIRPDHFWIVGGTFAIIIALHLFLTRTQMGRAMRGVRENPDLAAVSGIDVAAVIRVTWVIGASLAAIAGLLIGLTIQLRPSIGFDLLLPLFSAAILGGIGSVYGAVLGGLVIGIAESLAVLLIGPEYRAAIAFGVLFVILLVRPQGILGAPA